MSEQIKTPEALDALPVGTVVLDHGANVYEVYDDTLGGRRWANIWDRWRRTSAEMFAHIGGTFTVLFRPDAPTPTPAPQRSFPLDPLVDVLIEHQRTSVGDCRCGPRPLGSSFAEHVAAQIRAAGLSS